MLDAAVLTRLEDVMFERNEPFGRTMSLRQMMDRLIEDAMVFPREGGSAGVAEATMDVYEEGDNLVVEAPLPGFKPDDIDISVEAGMLTLRADSKQEQERKERNYLIRERRMGSFRRTLRLPETADANACQATFEDGVLRLTFPKTEASKPRRIQVSVGGQQRAMPAEGQGDQAGGTAQPSA
jgi:HSP20 family protein